MSAKKGDLDKALKKFESTLKQFWKGRYEEAMAAFEKLSEDDNLEPRLADRICTLINICKIRLGIDEVDPRSPEEHYLAGIIDLNNGRTEEGIAHLTRAVSRRKENDAWVYSLACAYALNGQEKKAKETLKKAIGLNADNRIYAFNCPDFVALRQNEDNAEIFGIEELENFTPDDQT
jgi:tetratricopeptide (TPR) repeat protein